MNGASRFAGATTRHVGDLDFDHVVLLPAGGRVEKEEGGVR